MKRLHVFFTTSFISDIGDGLLYFALPLGLGLEAKDLRLAVALFLVPAVAGYLASFLEKFIGKRIHSSHKDYGATLLLIAMIELFIALVSSGQHRVSTSFFLLGAFVFLYSFAKEGVPRLLYVVDIYNYFCSADEYSKVAGKHQAFGIIGRALGTLLAAVLLTRLGWRVALWIDACTFILYALTILFLGKEPLPQSASANQDCNDSSGQVELPNGTALICFFLPLEIGVSSLYFPFLPAISEKFSVLDIGNSLVLLTLLKLPGLFLGFYYHWLRKYISDRVLVWVIPISTVVGFALFLIFPSISTFAALILAHGLMEGVYWPADYSIRNQIPGTRQVEFNSTVLKRMSVFQFVGTIAAIFAFSSVQLRSGLSIALLCLLVLAGVTAWFLARARVAAPACISMLIAVPLFLTSCNSSNRTLLNIVLPATSHDLRIRSDITYAELIILNDTSAHLVRLGKDLEIQGELLRSYHADPDFKTYTIELNDKYKSERGESISAEDLKYTIQYFLAKHRDLAASLLQLDGAKECKTINCSLPGVQVNGAYRITMHLKSPNSRLIEDLVSPTFVILKKNRPEVEAVGDCLVPYQTGRAIVKKCDEKGIVVFEDGFRYLISKTTAANIRSSRIVTDNLTSSTYPSLTVLSVFPNPASKVLPLKNRVALLNRLHGGGKEISKALHLRWAATFTPEWIGEVPNIPETVSDRIKTPVKCPQRPLKVLLDTSLPYLEILKKKLSDYIPCPVEYKVTTANHYFDEFARSDLGIAWFTPVYLSAYDLISVFDCSAGAICYFNWRDPVLQSLINKLHLLTHNSLGDKQVLFQIEKMFREKGYVLPIAQMNWWIRKSSGILKPIHPAGLSQLRLRDFQ